MTWPRLDVPSLEVDFVDLSISILHNQLATQANKYHWCGYLPCLPCCSPSASDIIMATRNCPDVLAPNEPCQGLKGYIPSSKVAGLAAFTGQTMC
jgi:hypothetical protein